MKLTTKIITGIILSIFILSLIFITGFSFTDRKNFRRTYTTVINIPQNNITGIHTKPYRVIVLERENDDHDKRIYHILAGENCGLFLNPVTTEKEKNKLFIPDALLDFISTKTYDDTLTIKIKIEELREKYKNDEKTFASFTGINLYLYTSNVDVINKLYEIPTFIRNIKTDTIRASSNGHIHIESCTAHVIEPLKSQSFKINDCEINALKIDLDIAGNWNVENCKIDTENITGSGNHHIILTKNETKKTNWLPKNKSAKLNIALQGDTTQFVFR